MVSSFSFLMTLLYVIVGTEPAASTNLPNFIMIMTDDLGWGDVPWNGGSAFTPYLDDLRHSPHTIRFNRGYSGAPLCSPTRATVLTGRNGDRECIYSANPAHGSAWEVSVTLPLPTSTFTIAEAVKKADNNYQTAFFGKWHLGDFWDHGEGNKVSNPGNNGFDYWFATLGNAPTTTPNCECQAFSDTPDTCVKGHYTHSNSFCRTYWYANETDAQGVMNISYKIDRNYNNDSNNERGSYFMITKFEEWLQDMADLSAPMLVMLWFHAPHMKFVANDEFKNGCLNGLYCKANISYDAEELDYWGCIADMDTQVGRVRQLLKDYNIYNNTLFWFNSDNGPQLYTPGRTNGLRGQKNDVWEGGIRVPTILEWPAVIPNGSFVSSFPIVTNDLFPTVLEVLNIASDTPDWALDGQSIYNILQSGGGVNETRQKPIGFTYGGSGLSLAYMDNEWKVVENSNSCKGNACDIALYNLNDDPYEQNDLSSVYPDKLEQMQDDMYDWYKSVIKSQLHDTKCIIDRAKSYWEYVLIGGIVVVVLCCCCIILALKCGWLTLAACCWCGAKVVEEVEDEIQMADNTDQHEKTNTDIQKGLEKEAVDL